MIIYFKEMKKTMKSTAGAAVKALARTTAGAAVMLLALVMTVMMTACSTGDDGIADGPTPGPTVQPEQPEQPVAQGTTVHVSVGAGIDGSGQTRSAVVTESGKRTLRFTAAQGTQGQDGYVPADRLFVFGALDDNGTTKYLAGYLDMVGNPTNNGKSATFAGDLTVYANNGSESTYTFTAADPLTECSDLQAHLIAGGFYEGFFLVLSNYSPRYNYSKSLTTGDDCVNTLMTKGIAVVSETYSTADGFTDFQGDAILNCTLSGLDSDQDYVVSLLCVDDENVYNNEKEVIIDSYLTYETHVRSSDAGVATFAIPIDADGDRYVSVAIGDAIGNDKFIPLGKMTLAKNKVYNVERQWNGSMFVKTYDLTTVSSDLTLKDGYVLTGTLDVANHPVKISIADGAKVTLSGVTILGEQSDDYNWAGITCLGDAEITLSGTNTVRGFRNSYPGIFVPAGSTLTIGGSGSLNASSNGYGCGIGGGNTFDTNQCGNIHITGGTITATGGGGCAGIGGGSCGDIIISGGSVSASGGEYAAGIGSGHQGSCGDITISGATVSATGGFNAAGIGSGKGGSCGDITISTSASFTASAGSGCPNAVGAGNPGTCGAVIIGGTSSLPAERTDYGDGNDGVDPNEKDGNGTWIWQ